MDKFTEYKPTESNYICRFFITFKILTFVSIGLLFIMSYISSIYLAYLFRDDARNGFNSSIFVDESFIPLFISILTIIILILLINIISIYFLKKIFIKRTIEIGEPKWFAWTLLIPIYSQYTVSKFLFQYEPTKEPHTVGMVFRECLTILLSPILDVVFLFKPISKNELLLKLPAYWLLYGLTLKLMEISHWFVLIPYIWCSILFFRYSLNKSLLWKIISFIPIYRILYFGLLFIYRGEEEWR